MSLARTRSQHSIKDLIFFMQNICVTKMEDFPIFNVANMALMLLFHTCKVFLGLRCCSILSSQSCKDSLTRLFPCCKQLLYLYFEGPLIIFLGSSMLSRWSSKAPVQTSSQYRGTSCSIYQQIQTQLHLLVKPLSLQLQLLAHLQLLFFRHRLQLIPLNPILPLVLLQAQLRKD